MPLTKQQLVDRCVSPIATDLLLPGGGTVLVLPVGAALFREYRRSLRDADGNIIAARQPFLDELLVARVLLDPEGERMFSDDEVLAGAMNMFPPKDFDALMDWAWGFVGSGEDREKKSSATPSGEPS